MRELFKALSELETRLMEQYGVSLNEAMALCCIGGDTLTASVISENTGLSASHTSKVIRSGISISFAFSASKHSRPLSDKVKCICRLSLSPKLRTINSFSSINCYR